MIVDVHENERYLRNFLYIFNLIVQVTWSYKCFLQALTKRLLMTVVIEI